MFHLQQTYELFLEFALIPIYMAMRIKTHLNNALISSLLSALSNEHDQEHHDELVNHQLIYDITEK